MNNIQHKEPYFKCFKEYRLEPNANWLSIKQPPLQTTSSSFIETIPGVSLVLPHCQGNIGHFINDHYYSFFSLATYGAKVWGCDFDQLLILPSPGEGHLYLALNFLPPSLRRKIRILDPDIAYNLAEAYIPCQDRLLSFRVKGHTLLKEMRENFYSNTNPSPPPEPQALIYQFPLGMRGGSHRGRSILNVPELKNHLHNSNIKTLVIDDNHWRDTTVAQGMEAFTSSTIFIGAYGAWLTSTIVAPPSSRIFLLRHPELYESWWMHGPQGWSAEDYHPRDLGNLWKNVDCAHEQPPGVNLTLYDSQPARCANLTVNVNDIKI